MKALLMTALLVGATSASAEVINLENRDWTKEQEISVAAPKEDSRGMSEYMVKLVEERTGKCLNPDMKEQYLRVVKYDSDLFDLYYVDSNQDITYNGPWAEVPAEDQPLRAMMPRPCPDDAKEETYEIKVQFVLYSRRGEDKDPTLYIPANTFRSTPKATLTWGSRPLY